MKQRWVKTVEVCQHSAYRSASVENGDVLLFYQCRRCGMQWVTVMS